MLESATGKSAGIRISDGRYELGQRLGGGGSSDVYRAIDTVLDRPVAVKLFRPCADPTAERRFEAEARLIAPLAHPALVTIYDTGVDNGRPFQVLQLVEGPTLRDQLADGPLPTNDVVSIGIRLAEALAYVHTRGIVHRDVKPSNVLGDGDEVYLADFGISRLLDGAHLTASGLAVGTAAYMAPEQVRGDDVGPAADVYSLGLVLLEAVTGHREYPGNATETAMARLSRPPLVPTRLPAPLPSLLAAMTRDDPRERPSAEACATSLRDGLPVMGTTDSATGSTAVALPATAVPATDSDDADPTGTLVQPAFAPTSVPEQRPAETPGNGNRRRAVRLALAAVALVLALSAGVFALVDGDKPEQAPADTNPTPTAPKSSAPAQRTGGNANSPRVVAPPSSETSTGTDTDTPAPTPSAPPSTEPSTEPSQEPTGDPTPPPTTGATEPGDDGGDDGDGGDEGDNSGPGSDGSGSSNDKKKGKG